MKCKYCGSEMRKDDRDFNFKGNYDDYMICDNCGASAVVKVRYGQITHIIWDESVSK
jgi:DNA-directed RNA polymerase subunit RPC12/RpoP